MSAIHVTFFLKRPKAEDETSLYSWLHYDGRKVKYYCPEAIKPKFWDGTNHRAKQTKTFPQWPEFNARLQEFEDDIKTIYRKWVNDHGGSIPDDVELKAALNAHFRPKEVETKTKNIVDFVQELIKRSECGTRLHHKTSKPISPNTIKTYKTTLTHLQDFQVTSKCKLEFSNIDLDFYEAYKAYFIEHKKTKVNTAGKHIQLLKTMLNEAAEMGLHTNTTHKGKRFVTLREDTDNIYLTPEEVKELENLDLSAESRLDRVRDVFLIGVYTGQRYSDYSRIGPEMIGPDGLLHLTQVKTGNKVAIPIHKTVRSIFKKYAETGMPKISEQKFNEYLKDIGKKIPSLEKTTPKSYTKGGQAVTDNLARWQQLTTHTARRTYATNHFKSGKVSAMTIMAITGHTTEKNFQRYIKCSPTDHARMMPTSW
jgi:integrase